MTMKFSRLFSATTLAAVLFAAAPAPARADVKIAVVDLKRVFESYWRRDQAEKQLKERAGDFDKMRAQLMEDYKKSNEELKKLVDAAGDQAVSSSERDKRKGEAEKKTVEIRDQENSIRNFDNSSRQTLQEQQNRLRESVLKDIRAVVDEKAKTGGYQLVMDVASQSANFTPIVLYTTLTGTDVDITDAVLKDLNANAPKDAGAPAADAKKDKPAGGK